MPETIEDLNDTLTRADAHTAFLMRRIEQLEAEIKSLKITLKAAEYAAKVNYDGWQQEVARKSRS